MSPKKTDPRTVAKVEPGAATNTKHPLHIVATDEPSQSGANHQYEVRWPTPAGNEEAATVYLQHGATQGVTPESLLAIVIDHLEGVQKGPYANEGTAHALADTKTALDSVAKRNARAPKSAKPAKDEKPSPYPLTLRGEYGGAVGKPDVTVHNPDEEARARAEGFTLTV
jgi:hypothetical protein